jgi:ankyrin repeat protein
MHGRLSVMQSLVDLGVDVNTPKDSQDADDPFYTPEGPILQAAAEGHLEVVRWLLDNGARINFIVQGKNRCLPLLQAAANGHIDVVKILVQHGADIHSSWNGLNAVQLAENYGHSDVRDHLLSLERH